LTTGMDMGISVSTAGLLCPLVNRDAGLQH